MDTTKTPTPKRSNHFHHDTRAHRRAFLDTYAKQRAGIKTESVVVDEFEQSVEPEVVAVTTQLEPTTYMQQPPAQALAAIAQPILPARSSTTSPVAPVQKRSEAGAERKSYLDTLMHHHQQRVSQAPQAIETISEPIVTDNTQHLIDIDKQKKIEANLNALYNPRPLTSQIAKSQNSASAMHVRTIVASAMACGILSVGIFAFSGRYNPQPVVAEPIGSPVIEVEAPETKAPTGAPVATHTDYSVSANPTDPVQIIAASIGVNARINGLGNTQDGLIAVPRSYTTVGWYNRGSTVGQPGPVVMVGHFTGGYGGVFDKLKDIKDGDLITIKNGKNQVFTYRVTAKNEYAKDQVPMAEIFKKSDTSRLEIITCSGKWQSNSYNNRVVVSAELVQ